MTLMKAGEPIHLTRKELGEFGEYSAPLPSDTIIGKRWKRRKPLGTLDYNGNPKLSDNWVIGHYVEHPDPDKVGILWRDVVIVS